MSDPVYWTDPLKQEFTVTVACCVEAGQRYEATIKEHVVRPEGGGQAGDRGWVLTGTAEVPVDSVVERDGEPALVSRQPLTPGQSYRFKLDMDWRRRMMRNHSAEHLLVATVRRKRSEARADHVWIDGDHGTVEIQCEGVGLADLLAAEEEVQELIEEDIESLTRVVGSDQLDDDVRAREGVKSKHEKVRVISFGDYDSCACSGTHVLRTGDIGLFKVVDFKQIQSGLRVEFLTGHKAAHFCSEVFNAILSRKHEYPYEYEQIGQVIDKSKHMAAQYELLSSTVERILGDTMKLERHGEVAFGSEYLPGLDPAQLRSIIKQLPLRGPSAVLLFVPARKPSFLFVTSQLRHSARTYIEEAVKNLGGRGGGSGEVYTGGFSESSDPQKTYSSLVDTLRSSLRGI